MTLATQIVSDLDTFFDSDEFGESVSYYLAAYTLNFPVTIIICSDQKDDEIKKGYVADRMTVQIMATEFVINSWDNVAPAKNDLVYRYPDDLNTREIWKVREGPRLGNGVYTLELEKSGRPVPR